MESIDTQEEMDDTTYKEEDGVIQKCDQMSSEEEQLNCEKNQISENGLILEEKERLQARIMELEALYEKTRHDLEAARKALSKIETAENATTADEVKTDSHNSESADQKSSQPGQESEQAAGKEQARGNTFKIFVGNLSDFATSSDIRELFEAYGTVVEADVVKNYGFVHMEKENEGQVAIKALNGHMLRGKPMNVEASTRIKKGSNQTTKIFVGNVHRDAKRLELKSLFEAYGNVVEADILTNYAFVHMDDESQAEQAIQKLDGHELHGLRLTVQKSTSRSRPQAGMGNRDLYFRFGPGERGHSFGNRYDPYPPPPPPRYARDRMLRFRDDMFERRPSLPPLSEYMKYGRQFPQLSRYPMSSPSVSR
ncbi:uncharacterized protein [Panulirus ornatus]